MKINIIRHKIGMLDEDEWSSMLISFKTLFKEPKHLEIWEYIKITFSEDFVELVDEQIRQSQIWTRFSIKTKLDYLTRSLLHHPSPYIIYELDGSIAWANMAAIYIFELDQLNEISIKKIDDEIKNNFGDLDSIALYYDTPIEISLRKISFFMRTRVHMIPMTDDTGIMLIELLCSSRDGLNALKKQFNV